jgi:hypothetical protein
VDRLRGANAVTEMLDDDDRNIAARRLSRMVLRNLINGDILIWADVQSICSEVNGIIRWDQNCRK